MKKRKVREFKPGSVFYACLVYLFLYLPIFVVIAFSFNTSEMNITFQGFTVEWYGRMLENRQLMQSFFNTVIVAFWSTIISVVIGTLCALGLYKFEFKLKSLISSSLYIPIVIPELVFAIANRLKELPPVTVYEPEYVKRPPQIDTSSPVEITVEDGVYLVEGPWLQRLISNVNFGDYESRMWFDKMLREAGVVRQLEELGIHDGDIVSMYNLEFEYQH